MAINFYFWNFPEKIRLLHDDASWNKVKPEAVNRLPLSTQLILPFSVTFCWINHIWAVVSHKPMFVDSIPGCYRNHPLFSLKGQSLKSFQEDIKNPSQHVSLQFPISSFFCRNWDSFNILYLRSRQPCEALLLYGLVWTTNQCSACGHINHYYSFSWMYKNRVLMHML